MTATQSSPIGLRTLPSPEPLYSDGELLGPRPSRGLLLAIAAAVGTAVVIAIVIAVTSGASPRAPLTPAQAAMAGAPRTTSLPPPHATSGFLEIAGPAGARPSIGAVYYPPAPCTLDLPAGEYDVRLHARRRVIARHVTIVAGHTTSL